jgi:hypothetical protein
MNQSSIQDLNPTQFHPHAGSGIVNEGNGSFCESVPGQSWSAGRRASLGF